MRQGITAKAPRFVWMTFTAMAVLSACSSNKGTESVDPSQDMSAAMDTSPTVNSTDEVSNLGPVAAYGSRRAPRVKDQPFQVDGRWMNAFYMVRNSQETWTTLSEMIYDRADRADILSQWNKGGTLKVGRVVYYNSALRPEDSSSMKVLAMDFGIPMETITIKRGDTLSLIGQAMYGDAQTWKELAALNPQISSPDIIQVGQTLSVQPAQLDTRSILKQLIAAASANPSNSIGAGSDIPVTAGQISQDTAESDLGQLDPSKDASSAVAEPGKLTNLLSSNNVAKVGLAVILLGLVGFVLWRRRQAQSQLDTLASWPNDQATNVTKLSNPTANG